MTEPLATYLPWALSALTILAIELQGRKWPQAWAVSLANQVVWVAWILASESWGFAPMCAILSVQYARNHLRWVRDERERHRREALLGPQHWNCRSAIEPKLQNGCTGCSHRRHCEAWGCCIREEGAKASNRAQGAPKPAGEGMGWGGRR